MRQLRRVLVTAGLALALTTTAPAGGAATAAAAPEPGTLVQEGGALGVPAGEEGPVTTRLTATLPPGFSGTIPGQRLAFQALSGIPGDRPGPRITSTCAVDGGAFAPCAWDSPDPETVDGVWLLFDLPAAHVPAGAATVTYDITVDAGSDLAQLGHLSTAVDLRDTAGTVVAEGELAFSFVQGTPEARLRSSLHARDRDGVLWQYDATGRGDTPLKPRKRVGGGWNAYTALTKLDRTTAAGGGDLVARDRAGVLWYYRGSGREGAPFEPRRRVGGGWNAYTSLVGLPGGDLFARDRDGVLWRYPGTGAATQPFGRRVRVGGGWNAYRSIVAFGDGLITHTPDGRQWRYEKADDWDPAVPFKPRRAVGGGWNVYTALAGTGRIGPSASDGPSLAARTGDGRLVVYGVVRFDGKSEPYYPRPGGRGWNIYDLLV
ncbi:tachylectin [Streptomyces sp. PanSC19]|uniref:tachylectin-related carbohydrate-binding protein n=1 Tax=Streptomyces sp. PanSC19 TaxID=1520455 RepID=UPI000F45FEFF|nr:tachylectin-related carbohydrate-binding protein [Streptomyces sp. PanSC19]ROQ32453.1 tachylectin [Streptomyces sp. PanSC19]